MASHSLRPRTRLVALDTEPFVAAHFNYTYGALGRILALAEEDRLRLLLTDVVLRELQANIATMVDQARGAHKRFRHDNGILSGLDDTRHLVAEFDVGKVKAQLIAGLESALRRAKATILATDHITVATILEWYFAERPPFGAGRHKYEFPDAISIQRLRELCGQEQEVIYVVSNDDGWMSACGTDVARLRGCRSLQELLNLIALEDEERATFVIGIVEQQQESIAKRTGLAFEHLSFVLADQNGDVQDVSVRHVVVGPFEILEIKDTFANVEILAKVEFMADVSYRVAGPGNDSHDLRPEAATMIHRRVENETDVSVSLQLAFASTLDPASVRIVNVTVMQEDVEVRADANVRGGH
jgi:hypothetical protein